MGKGKLLAEKKGRKTWPGREVSAWTKKKITQKKIAMMLGGGENQVQRH